MYKTILKTFVGICLLLQFDIATGQECDYTTFDPFTKAPYVNSINIGQYAFPSTYEWYSGKSGIMPNFDKEELEKTARLALLNSINIDLTYELKDHIEESSEFGLSIARERTSEESVGRSRENLQSINFIYIKYAEGFQATVYRCKSEHDEAKLEAVENIKIKLNKYDKAISDENYQMAFDLLCNIYLESFYNHDTLRHNIENKITNFMQNLECTLDDYEKQKIYSPNENVDDEVKISCYFGEIPLSKFNIQVEVNKGRLEGREWSDLKRYFTTDNKGAINLAPFLILSANSPQISLIPDIKIEEGIYPQKLEEKLNLLIIDNINKSNYHTIKVDNYLRIDLDKIDIGEGQDLITDRGIFIDNFKSSIKSLSDWYKSDERGGGVIIDLYKDERNIEGFIRLDLSNHQTEIKVKYFANITPGKKTISNWLTKLRYQYKKELFTSEIAYRLDDDVILEWTDDNSSGKEKYNASDNGRDTIEVSMGNVNIRYLLKDRLFPRPCFRDTQFVVSEPFIELNNGLKIEFNQKFTPYKYHIVNNIPGRAEFEWDGEEQDYGLRGNFYGLNDKSHTLRVRKNGYLVDLEYNKKSYRDKVSLPPNYKGELLPKVYIKFNAIKKGPFNYIKYFSIPGYGQNSLYKTSAIRKIESGLLFLGTIGLLYAQKEYSNNIQLHSNNKIDCLVEYNNLEDGTSQEIYAGKRACVEDNKYQEDYFINKYNNNIWYLGGLFLFNFMDIVVSWHFDIE